MRPHRSLHYPYFSPARVCTLQSILKPRQQLDLTKHRITLQDIADEVGKSRMTVSLALRDSPKTSKSTRALIQSAAERMGYRSDPEIVKLMDHLRAHRTRQIQYTLAYLNHHHDKNIRATLKDVDSFFLEAKKQAWQLGYQLEEFWTQEPELSAKRLSQILFSRGIKGVIIGPTTLDTQELKLDWPLFSSIALGYSLLKPDLHRVLSNRYENTLLALDRLRANGYERIGCAISSDLDHLIHKSYTAAILTYNLELPPKKQAQLFRPKKWDKTNFMKWFRKEKPDVIFGSPDCVAWLERESIQIPESVAFAMELDHTWPVDFSGTRSNLAQLGKVAVNFLVDQINRGETGIPEQPIAVYVKGEWHAGTTAPLISGKKSSARGR